MTDQNWLAPARLPACLPAGFPGRGACEPPVVAEPVVGDGTTSGHSAVKVRGGPKVVATGDPITVASDNRAVPHPAPLQGRKAKFKRDGPPGDIPLSA